MDEPLMLLSTALDAMLEDCTACRGSGVVHWTRVPTTAETAAAIGRTHELADYPNLAAVLDAHPRRVAAASATRIPMTSPCQDCAGVKRVVSAEGRALLARFAGMLAPFLGEDFAVRDHTHSVEWS